MTNEGRRLQEAREGVPWRTWGPYLSERQWGTVREDYSDNGDAWSYLSHDQARSRAYRWGEDGLAGISDDQQRLCFAVALWNERDPILKERLFGLTNAEGNHGEDVKEYYFYVDNLPTHSYQRWLYKYPHAAFPYDDLVLTNRSRVPARHGVRARSTPAYSTTGTTSTSRSSTPRRSPKTSGLSHHRAQPLDGDRLAPRASRRFGSATRGRGLPTDPSPRSSAAGRRSVPVVEAEHDDLGDFYLYAEAGAELLFCENESNAQRLWGVDGGPAFPKDGINDHVVHGAATR